MKNTFIWFLLMFICQMAAGQQVIQLYNSNLPAGSEMLNLPEKSQTNAKGQIVSVANVSRPTLTVIAPEKGRGNGTAVIVCPGGAFRFLSFGAEGFDVANWFVSKGITAFILKYRLVPEWEGINNTLYKDLSTKNFARIDSVNAPFVPLAVADGREAVRYVRQHASEYGIETNRIGMIGFSAGGTVVGSVAQTYDQESRPDFAAPIYAYCGAIIGDKVPADAPPMFLALAADDPIADGNTQLYEKWRDAGKSVEMHIFPKGGHGFGIRTNNQPTDEWISRFEDWLFVNGFILPSRTIKMFNRSLQVIHNAMKDFRKRAETDWAYLKRYEADNNKLGLPKKGEKRIVFMGNSITEGWITSDSSFFKSRPYIDRGISGQTTDQMLVRIRPDVVDLKPSVVVILAGTNDINGEKPLEQIMNNIISMAELAKANNIKLVLCSVTPVIDYPRTPGLNPAEKVPKLNGMIKAYAARNKIIYVDYYTAMVDEKGGMRAELTNDGLHPTLSGYKIMEPLVEAAIAKALKVK